MQLGQLATGAAIGCADVEAQGQAHLGAASSNSLFPTGILSCCTSPGLILVVQLV